MKNPAITTGALLILLHWSPAAAQDRLVIGSREVGAMGRFGQAIGDADPAVHLGVLAGGRAVVSGPDRVRDVRTGLERVVPGPIAAVDPSRPRVFLHPFLSGVRVVDLATGEMRTVWDEPWVRITIRYASSADRLVLHVVRPGLPLTTSLLVIDVATGAVVQAHDGVLPVDVGALVVSDDAARVFAALPSGLLAVDTETGATTGAAPLALGSASWDSRAGRLIVFATDLRTGQHVLGAYSEDLAVLGAATVPDTCGTVRASAHTGRIYFNGERLRVFGANGQLIDDQPVRIDGRPGVPCDEMTLVTAPGTPQGLSAAVSGRDLSLRWTGVGAASGFVLEVGLGPGRTDASLFLGPAPAVMFAGVPPGVYYARMRGTNELGASAPSAEVRIIVP